MDSKSNPPGAIEKYAQTREADQECLPLLAICFTAEELDIYTSNKFTFSNQHQLICTSNTSHVPVTMHFALNKEHSKTHSSTLMKFWDSKNKAPGPAFCKKYYIKHCSPAKSESSSRYIWFPSFTCVLLHYISHHRHWSWFKDCNVPHNLGHIVKSG